jgi:hypothetical protein
MDSQGRRIRVFDTPLVSGLNALAAVVGLLALLFATALYMLTFLPGDVGLGSAEFAPFFALVFPLWFGMFYALGSRGVLRREGTRRFDISAGLQSQLRMFRLMPRASYVVVPIFVILGVFGFESSFHSLAGQPEYTPWVTTTTWMTMAGSSPFRGPLICTTSPCRADCF